MGDNRVGGVGRAWNCWVTSGKEVVGLCACMISDRMECVGYQLRLHLVPRFVDRRNSPLS